MKIPVEWLKEYVPVKKPAKDVAESFTLLGLMLDKAVQTYKDGRYSTEVLDLEHRMDRSDWLSMLGCARDYAAFEGVKFEMPPVHKEPGLAPKQEQIVKIEVACPDVVNRFNTRVFRNIKVKPSPSWLKNRLKAYGMTSVNNIVDITNYVMIEYGQPMHAQDLSKMETQEIVIRKAKDGEEVTTLLGETVKLTPNQFVLTQDGKATVIGGIVGGNTTGVDEKTTDIVLDAGNYNQNNIRKSSRSLKILNETVLRYDKYLHPELTQRAMERAVYLILELAGGDYYENVDWCPKNYKRSVINFRTSRLEQMSGMVIEQPRIKEIIEALGYKILQEGDSNYELEVPYFRTDVVVEDDVVADILRINNYEKIPIKLVDGAPPKDITPAIYMFEEQLRDHMVSLGFHEHITDPLIIKDDRKPDQVVLENALTTEKSALRTDMETTLKPVADNYEKHGHLNIRIFEIGKTYHTNGHKSKFGSYEERRSLQVWQKISGNSAYETSRATKQVLATLMRDIGLRDYNLEGEGSEADIIIAGDKVGKLTMFGFVLFTKILLKQAKASHRVVSELPNYTVEKLSLVLDLNEPFGPVYQEIKSFHRDIIDVEVEEEYTGKGPGKKKKAVLVKITYVTSL